MKSLYLRILIASVAAVVVSVAALVGIYFGITVPATSQKVHAVEDTLANDAADVFTRGGAPALQAYFDRIEAAQPGMNRSLVDANGRAEVGKDLLNPSLRHRRRTLGGPVGRQRLLGERDPQLAIGPDV